MSGPLPSGIRIALFSCLLLLALYVLFITLRMREQPPLAAATAAVAAQSSLAASQADKTIATPSRRTDRHGRRPAVGSAASRWTRPKPACRRRKARPRPWP